eukprot:18624_1
MPTPHHLLDSHQKNTKFNIVNDEKQKHDTNKHDTYLDQMIKHLLNSKLDEIHIKQFMDFITQQKHDTNKHDTYLDQMIKHLLNSKLDEIHIKQFMDFITQQQYDTDAIDHDHTIKPQCNISAIATQIDGQLLKYYNQLIEDARLEASSFAIGFRFYYWPCYKGIRELTYMRGNLWDHGGYDIKELFIEAKFASFKEEIAHYKYVSLKQYE